jgi:hypothetical protein
MEEAPENSKDSLYSAHATGVIDYGNTVCAGDGIREKIIVLYSSKYITIICVT